tara:strand:+ start:4384 stop:5526 length:1143 start_codon:yes stop_codon:yes gene_type:complete
MINKKISFLTILFISLILIELFAFLTSKLNLLFFNDAPVIYLNDKKQIIDNYWTEEEIWGAWHTKNFKTVHKKKCFDVQYETNEIGARDTPFNNIGNKKNIILLGDSFAEGYGINKDEMFEKKIENILKRNILNFSSSKDFGMIQYFLVYEYLAKNYQHDTIIISFLPNNDFKDNDYKYYKDNKFDFNNKNRRHRPYYIKSKNKFEIIYPEVSLNDSVNLLKIIKKYLWTSNVLRSIKYYIVSGKIKKAKKKQIKESIFQSEHITDYYFTPLYQQEAITFFLEKFIKNNANKKIILFSIPLYEDYEIIKENDFRETINWWKKFRKFEKDYKNFYFLDLIDNAPIDYKNYFFPKNCDNHWNKKGHEWAGKNISKFMLEVLN